MSNPPYAVRAHLAGRLDAAEAHPGNLNPLAHRVLLVVVVALAVAPALAVRAVVGARATVLRALEDRLTANRLVVLQQTGARVFRATFTEIGKDNKPSASFQRKIGWAKRRGEVEIGMEMKKEQ